MPAAIPRRSPFRKLIAVAIGIGVLVVAAIVVAQSQLNPERLRDALQRSVHRATGRDLAISGGVHLQLGLAPTLVVDGISLANLPGGSRPQMLTAQSLTANLALLPLLGGDAVISAMTIDQPDILLERLPDGTPNWQFAATHRALYQGSGASGGAGGTSGGRVEIHTLNLRDGKVTWHDAGGRNIALDIPKLRLTNAGDDAPLALSFTVDRGGEPFDVEATSGSLERLQGGLSSKLAGAWPLTVDASGAGAKIHLEGGITHPEQMRGYQFKLHADIPDLGAMNGLVPEAHLPPFKAVVFTGTAADGTEGEVRTSQISLEAGESDLSGQLQGLQIKHLSFKAPGPGQIAQLSVEGSYSGSTLRASGTAMQPDVLTASAPTQVTLNGQAADATVEIHGTLPASQAAAGLDLRFALHAPDLAQLSQLAGHPLPAARDVALSFHATDAGFRLHGVSIGELSFASSMGDLSGAVTIGWSPRPTVRGTLASNTLDADGLWSGMASTMHLPDVFPTPDNKSAPVPLPADGNAPLPAVDGQLQPAPWGRLAGYRIPAASLRLADVDLALTAGNLTLGGEHYRDLDTHLQLDDGKLAVNPFRISSPEGAIVGALTVDATTDVPPVALTMRSAGLSAPAVARLLGSPGGAAGTMQLDAQLSGAGDNAASLLTGVDGHIGLAMVNGEIDNALVETLIGTALDAAGAPSLGGGRSAVMCLALRANFTHGRGRVGALSFDTSRLSMDGTGGFDLAGRTLDLHLRPHLRLGGASAEAPILVSGSFDDPTAKLDPVLGGRVGITIGSITGADQGSACVSKLAVARNGLPGPMPAQQAAPSQEPNPLRKLPTDLLRGLFH